LIGKGDDPANDGKHYPDNDRENAEQEQQDWVAYALVFPGRGMEAGIGISRLVSKM